MSNQSDEQRTIYLPQHVNWHGEGFYVGPAFSTLVAATAWLDTNAFYPLQSVLVRNLDDSSDDGREITYKGYEGER